MTVGGVLLKGIQIEKLLYMNYYIVFTLVPWIHCFVYISKGLVTRRYIHFMFITFVLESMLLQVVQTVLLLVVFLLVGLVRQSCMMVL